MTSMVYDNIEAREFNWPKFEILDGRDLNKVFWSKPGYKNVMMWRVDCMWKYNGWMIRGVYRKGDDFVEVSVNKIVRGEWSEWEEKMYVDIYRVNMCLMNNGDVNDFRFFTEE